MAKLSIIIPVYNTEKEIGKCLDSILNQTDTSDIEILVINDGSKDNSEEIINSYQKKDKRIYYFSKENEGIAKTRNFGIEKANGDYLLFVDSDDYLALNTLEKIKPHIEKGIELIKFKLQRVDETGKIIEKVDGPIFDIITGEEAFNQLYSEDVLLDSPCLYAIKKELLTKNKFKFQRTYHEDFGLIPLLILSAKTIISIPDYLYQYVQVPNSITRNEDYRKTCLKMNDALAHYDNMIKFLKMKKIDKRTSENIKIYYTNAIILKLKELKQTDIKKYNQEIKKRKMINNIKVRNLKQAVKKIILKIDINLYLKLR